MNAQQKDANATMDESYYYVSLKWTRKGNKVFKFFCPNHNGYTSILEKAGLYDKPHENSSLVLSVKKETIDSIKRAITGIDNEFDMESFTVVPNIGVNRRMLGITEFDFKHDGNDDFMYFGFDDTVYEKSKTITTNSYRIRAKDTVSEFWYYDVVIEASSRNKAINIQYKSRDWDSLADTFIEFKKQILCSKEKVVVFDKWSDE